jgi:hypothetical protein
MRQKQKTRSEDRNRRQGQDLPTVVRKSWQEQQTGTRERNNIQEQETETKDSRRTWTVNRTRRQEQGRGTWARIRWEQTTWNSTLILSMRASALSDYFALFLISSKMRSSCLKLSLATVFNPRSATDFMLSNASNNHLREMSKHALNNNLSETMQGRFGGKSS